MRNILLLLLFISSISFAQNGINYQGAATDSQGNKLENQSISLKTSILQGGIEGSASYSETHNTTTDQFGLFNVVIGLGEVLTGSFDSIQWGADAHYLKVELDANGGTDYSLISTTQMMSVPYAKYAENAGLDSLTIDIMIENAINNYLSQNSNSFINFINPINLYEGPTSSNDTLSIDINELISENPENLLLHIEFEGVESYQNYTFIDIKVNTGDFNLPIYKCDPDHNGSGGDQPQGATNSSQVIIPNGEDGIVNFIITKFGSINGSIKLIGYF